MGSTYQVFCTIEGKQLESLSGIIMDESQKVLNKRYGNNHFRHALHSHGQEIIGTAKMAKALQHSETVAVRTYVHTGSSSTAFADYLTHVGAVPKKKKNTQLGNVSFFVLRINCFFSDSSEKCKKKTMQYILLLLPCLRVCLEPAFWDFCSTLRLFTEIVSEKVSTW